MWKSIWLFKISHTGVHKISAEDKECPVMYKVIPAKVLLKIISTEVVV